MEYDLHSRIKSVNALDLQAISSDTTTVGNIIDTIDFESIDFIGFAKAVTDGEYTLKLEHGDESDLSDAADVPAADIVGSLFQFDEYKDDETLRTGYIGKKRFVRASLVSTNTTTGVDMIGIIAALGHPKTLPTAEQV